MDTREVASQYRLTKWTELISQCRCSGQTVAVWCAENNISQASYYYWLKKIRNAACEALPSLNGNNPIVPLNIFDRSVETRSSDQESSSGIVMRIGAITLEISNTATSTLIENTVRALQHVR